MQNGLMHYFTQDSQLESQQSQPLSQQQNPGKTVCTISGVEVEFPTKPYPSQLAMMSKVIQGLKRGQNCLLESPTGSGKSLALLCAALAWQRHEAARVAEYNDAIDARELAKLDQGKELLNQKNKNSQVNNSQLEAEKATPAEADENTSLIGTAEHQTSGGFDHDCDSDDDFQPFKPGKKSSISPSEVSIIREVKAEKEISTAENTQANVCCKTAVDDTPELELATKKLSVPKVFFGTRTHKQIAQITRELRKTTYKTVRSTILSSREHSCINPIVMRLPNKNEACKDLLDSASSITGSGCGFHTQSKKFGNFDNLINFGVKPGFDMEDLIQAGRSYKACPYYAARHLMLMADIVFCPYNYLIDPQIRKSMSIELQGQVVIFDEGHNLEDASREAASFSLALDEIQGAIQDVESVGKIAAEPFAHEQLAQFLSMVAGWITQHANDLKSMDFNNSGKTWTGTDFVASANQAGINSDLFGRIQTFFQAIMAQRDLQIEEAKETGGSRSTLEKPTITSQTIYVSETILRMFNYLTRDAGRQRDDFRLALLKSIKRRRTERRGVSSAQETLSLNFWCLNPAVEFVEIKNKAHCIILTSGTLSPMTSFQTELGTKLPIQLEASHIINPDQIWAAVIGRGPTNVNLNGSYRNAESFDYQDDVGRLVYDVCSTMPHGVLCFFSSYRAIETFVNRWTLTGRWDDISKFKRIFLEPRTGPKDFEDAIADFYSSVEGTKDCDAGYQTGALFLAVCRGKVSEGLDFADNNARAVICVGIPFPNYFDMQVQQKRAYNDKNRHLGLLSGGDWYEVQAFRALNQALGRCIRHRNDWGAIILVDERYMQTPRYISSLSKWIRSSVKSHNSWKDALNSFTLFRDSMKARSELLPTTFDNGLADDAISQWSTGSNKDNPIQCDPDEETKSTKRASNGPQNDKNGAVSTNTSTTTQRRGHLKKMFF